MSIVLQNAVLLPLLAAAVVPVLIHLLARPRPSVRPFSSVDFLLRALRFRHRFRRPQNWLLLLVRTLFVLVLAAVFLRPLLLAEGGQGRDGRRTNVVVLIDASASMAYVDGAQTRFSAACAEASKVLAGLRAGDWANVIWARHRPVSEYPAPGPNHEFLRSALLRATPSREAADAAAALATAVEQLSSVTGRKEIVVLSDFQATAWREFSLTVPPDIRLSLIPVGQGHSDNVALVRVTASPVPAFVGEDLVVSCSLANFSDRRRVTTVFVEAGAFRANRDVPLDAWDGTEVAFHVPARAAGPLPIQVALSEDDFPLDNNCSVVADVEPGLRVVLVSDDDSPGNAWRRALRSYAWVRPADRALQDVGLVQTATVLVLDGVQEDALGPALRFAEQGGTVLWSVPLGTTRLDAAWFKGTAGAEAEVRWERCKGDAAVLRFGTAGAALSQALDDGEFACLRRFLVRQRFVVEPQPAGDPGVLVGYGDGAPAVVQQKRGRGTFLVWMLPLLPEFGNIPTRPEFLPLLGELLLAHRPLDATRAGSVALVPGDVLTPLSNAPETAVPPVPLDSAGRPLAAAAARTAAAPVWVAAEPGIIEWRRGADTVGWTAVNLDPVESDLRAMSSDELASAWNVSTAGGGSRVRREREGQDVWPRLLLALGLLVLCESLLTVWSEGESMRPALVRGV